MFEIEASKHPRFDLKVVSVIEIMFLYDAHYANVLLRPKTKGKLSTQSAEKWICMGEWAFKILAKLFLKNEKASGDRSFPNRYATKLLGKKETSKKAP